MVAVLVTKDGITILSRNKIGKWKYLRRLGVSRRYFKEQLFNTGDTLW